MWPSASSAQEQVAPAPRLQWRDHRQGTAEPRRRRSHIRFWSDGREIRLAAIEVPPLAEPQEGSPASRRHRLRKDALAALLSGAQITLKQADAQKTDRYGRLVAYAVRRARRRRSLRAEPSWSPPALRGSRRTWAAAPVRWNSLRRETLARKAKLGLWASSYYDLLNADDPADVLAERGRFALVEGKVLSVRESGATIYVNFGRRWTEDFTVTILKRNERNFTAAGLEPKKLAGRRIRVRGWIEERGGPWIEATRPEQIEFADRE